METVKEKIAYLRGLLDSDEVVAQNPASHRLWEGVLATLDAIGAELERVARATDEHDEYLTALDEDLGDLEDEVYGTGEDDEESDEDVQDEESDDEETEDEGETFIEVECPHCHEKLYVEADLLDDENVQITCPECNQPVYTGSHFRDLTPARDGQVPAPSPSSPAK
ncbi:MAG: AraC family transcriptional regulator [Limnochordaceae bacterium]|nr:AraC family transcriptional regulator [Limnochordaceae bacterium]